MTIKRVLELISNNYILRGYLTTKNERKVNTDGEGNLFTETTLRLVYTDKVVTLSWSTKHPFIYAWCYGYASVTEMAVLDKIIKLLEEEMRMKNAIK